MVSFNQDLHSKSMTDLGLLRVQNGGESEALGVTAATLQDKLSQVVKEVGQRNITSDFTSSVSVCSLNLETVMCDTQPLTNQCFL